MYSRRSFIKKAILSLASLLWSSCQFFPARWSDAISEPTPDIVYPNTDPDHKNNIELDSFQVLADGIDFPESPTFDNNGNLWCTEMHPGNLIFWDQEEISRYACNGRPNSIIFDKSNVAWICDSENNAIRTFNPQNQTWITITDKVNHETLQTPNDLIFDAEGNLIFTCPNYQDSTPRGYVCSHLPFGETIKIAEGMYRPNGIVLLNESKTLIVADTFLKQLFIGNWDSKNTTLSKLTPWITIGGAEGPDGLTVSSDEKLFCAVFGVGIIKVLDKFGNALFEIHVPGQNPTNVALDPKGELGLVVTEAEKGLLLSFPNIKNLPG